MTVLANVTEGITLITGTLIPGAIAVFSEPPLVYFVGLSLVLAVGFAIKHWMRR